MPDAPTLPPDSHEHRLSATLRRLADQWRDGDPDRKVTAGDVAEWLDANADAEAANTPTLDADGRGTIGYDYLRPFTDLRRTGLLWLINATVFHPRGFALGLVFDDEAGGSGWALLGDGSEPFQFEHGSFAEQFAAANATLTPRPTEGPADA